MCHPGTGTSPGVSMGVAVMNAGESYFGNRSSMFALGPIKRGPSILSVEALINFIVKVGGHETTGQAYWNPKSSWDYITVAINYTLSDYYKVPKGECEWD